MKSFKKQPLTTTGLILFFITMCFPMMHAQRHEIGVRLGMSNLVGDIGRTGYILQKPFGTRISDYGIPFYGGLMYRMNFNPYQTLRFDAGYAFVQFDDKRAKEQYRKNRGIAGTNGIYNADVQFEYNFLPVNNEQKSMLSPYVFGGIGGILFSDRKVVLDFTGKLTDADADGVIDQFPISDYSKVEIQGQGSKIKISIPFGAGLKYKFNYNWALSGEFKFRYTSSDLVDYSRMSPGSVIVKGKVLSGPNLTETKLTREQITTLRNGYIGPRTYGNSNSMDWVNSITLGLSYSFGRPPCYCE